MSVRNALRMAARRAAIAAAPGGNTGEDENWWDSMFYHATFDDSTPIGNKMKLTIKAFGLGGPTELSKQDIAKLTSSDRLNACFRFFIDGDKTRPRFLVSLRGGSEWYFVDPKYNQWRKINGQTPSHGIRLLTEMFIDVLPSKITGG